MVTFHKHVLTEVATQANNMTATYYKEGTCLSTDEKPTGGDLYNGSKLDEIDTGKSYRYNAAGETWVEWASGNGGELEQ